MEKRETKGEKGGKGIWKRKTWEGEDTVDEKKMEWVIGEEKMKSGRGGRGER